MVGFFATSIVCVLLLVSGVWGSTIISQVLVQVLVQLHTAITVSRGFSIRMVVSHMTGTYLMRLHTLTT